MATVSLDRVTKAFGQTRVLDGLSIDIADGELFVLVGPSGCGKTTTLRVIAGLEQTDGGTISIGDRDVTSAPPGARDAAMVFQSYALFPHLSVAENLSFGLSARRLPRDQIERRVSVTASKLDIETLLERKPRELSGGERQRVALGRALVRDPSVLLMDEPLSNLDPPLRAQTRREIVALQQQLRTTTVYVTHDQVEALAMGHRLAVMREGRVEQIGRPHEVYDRPGTLFVARFTGSPPMNVLAARVEDGAVVWAGGRLEVPGLDRTRREIVLGVRPEHVHVVGSRWSGPRGSAPSFAGRIERLELLGDQSIAEMEVFGSGIVARVEPGFGPARGDVVEAWLDPGRLHLFDPRTEQRL